MLVYMFHSHYLTQNTYWYTKNVIVADHSIKCKIKRLPFTHRF